MKEKPVGPVSLNLAVLFSGWREETANLVGFFDDCRVEADDDSIAERFLEVDKRVLGNRSPITGIKYEDMRLIAIATLREALAILEEQDYESINDAAT